MTLELSDIQGLLIRGYKGLPNASYVLVRFDEKEKVKGYLNLLANEITNGTTAPENHAVNAAFTYEGLAFLGLNEDSLGSFSREFKEGMSEKHRQIVLGDIEENAPEKWLWGGPHREQVHMMLLLYSKDDAELQRVVEIHRTRFNSSGIKEVIQLTTVLLPEGKEHFGFRDGISQPFIRGLSKSASLDESETLPAGEFILGYHNLYDQYPDSPSVSSQQDPLNTLSIKADSANDKDLGKNGSYLVFRQLSQNVHRFWQYLKSESMEPKSVSSEDAAIKLASKMVGRWPGGAPLVTSEMDDPDLSYENDFKYWKEDFNGLKCPIGAHIRRANPRDWLLTEKTAVESEEMVMKHRILRRGRSYGKPLAASMEPRDFMNAKPDQAERGLHFICFVGDIIRQFEFIQNAWVRFHKFGGLYDDSDPLIGTHYNKDGVVTDSFTVQACPARRRYKNMPQFTELKGGEYFFLPGIRAIRYLSALA